MNMMKETLPGMTLGPLDDTMVDPLTKGMPLGVGAMRLGDIGAQGWNMLRGDLPFPIAVIRDDRLRANSAWMRDFTAANGLELAPHGKTTMAPHLYDLQISDGAWGITLATAQQVLVAHRFGVGRVVLANQPIGRQNIDACFSVLHGTDGIELYCLADSIEGVGALAEGATRNPPSESNPLRILVEVGFVGGRTGVRSGAAALKLARAVAAAPGLAFAGIECFEGVAPDPDAAAALVDDIVAAGHAVLDAGLLPDGAPLVLSAGGSAFFDRVGERLNAAGFARPVVSVLRSGCYLTHDVMGYARAFERIQRETSLIQPEGGLEPALEVWALVQSRPDADKVILTMGKRDVGSDAGLPKPMWLYRDDGSMTAPVAMPEGHEVQALNDQHCHMTVPPDSRLRVGDMVGFGIGHPCTTFDKWKLLMIVDDDYTVTKAIMTFF